MLIRLREGEESGSMYIATRGGGGGVRLAFVEGHVTLGVLAETLAR